MCCNVHAYIARRLPVGWSLPALQTISSAPSPSCGCCSSSGRSAQCLRCLRQVGHYTNLYLGSTCVCLRACACLMVWVWVWERLCGCGVVGRCAGASICSSV
eukprot:97999-Pelagomonas_calceolata.AAC.1